MKKALIIAAACALPLLVSCEKQENGARSLQKFAERSFAAPVATSVTGLLTASECGSSGGDQNFGGQIGYRIIIRQGDRPYSGRACHRLGAPDWRIWLDAPSVLEGRK